MIVIQGNGNGKKPAPKGNGGTDKATEARLDKLEKAIDRLADALKKKGKGKDDDETARSDAPAQITVKLPAAAQLYVDDVLCPLTSAQRSFSTPKLQAGQKYGYTLRVEMSSNGQSLSKSQQVVIVAGQHLHVDFNATTGVFVVKD